MKIYTRSGDTGETGLVTGERVAKSHPRIEANGELDELNCLLGVARATGPAAGTDATLDRLQNVLFALGADVSAGRTTAEFFPAGETGWLESEIDRLTAALPPLTQFLLPGGTPTAAALHVARAACRRAERRLVALAATGPVPDGAVVFLNRLSDFLFTLARWENIQAGRPEPLWTRPG
jgi:cob(I)alamin adenosyltransferase